MFLHKEGDVDALMNLSNLFNEEVVKSVGKVFVGEARGHR